MGELIYICPECGSRIDENSDFCCRCGCLKSKARVLDSGSVSGLKCPGCGAEVARGEMFCGNCGSPLNAVSPLNFDKSSAIAFVLAFVPGLFSVYGLGHLFLREWIRGLMFLSMTGIYWYVVYASGRSLVIEIISIGIFLYQMMDIFRVSLIRRLKNV
ncbi:MAG: zinc ribbon domain-containing protein [Candidatus Methanomethylophilaceae archaeon]|nr:zinc ribbon domain-containing protein [Candidatus Methanomethylophilaceae archaeon]